MFYCKIILYINVVLSTGVGKIDWPPIGRQRSWCFENYSFVRVNRHLFGSFDHSALSLLQITDVSHWHKHYHLYERKVLAAPPILDLHTLPLESFLIWTPHPSKNCIFSLILSFANFGLLIPPIPTTSPLRISSDTPRPG